LAKKNKIAIANGLIWIFQALFGARRLKPELLPEHEFKRIAVFSTTALGDLMFNTPAIHQLRLRYPQAKLILFVHRKYLQMVEHYPDVDQVYEWDGRINDLLGVARQLRQNKVELAVILHSRAPYDVLCAVFGRCTAILRDDSYVNGEVPLHRWLTATSKSDFGGHVIQRKLDLLSVLGCRTDQTEMQVPCPVDRSRYTQPGTIRIGFQMGASKPDRRWPVAHFACLAAMLTHERPDIRIILLGTAQEHEIEQAFLSTVEPGVLAQVESLVGKTSIRDALDAVASLNVLVTPDTGPLHLAVALKVPTVSLFANANAAETGPYQDAGLHRIIQRPPAEKKEDREVEDEMEKIRPEQVFGLLVEFCGLIPEQQKRVI
jgi:ADP-heptose:LPS heptosyltransferase